MATSRKKSTAEALGAVAGWESQFGDQQQQPKTPTKGKKRGKLKRKTYLMTDELIERIEAFAEAHSVGINEAVRYLILTGFDAIETGDRDVKTQTVQRNTLGV